MGTEKLWKTDFFNLFPNRKPVIAMLHLKADGHMGMLERAKRELAARQGGASSKPRSQALMDEYERAEAAGDYARADELLREATHGLDSIDAIDWAALDARVHALLSPLEAGR